MHSTYRRAIVCRCLISHRQIRIPDFRLGVQGFQRAVEFLLSAFDDLGHIGHRTGEVQVLLGQ